MSHLPVGQMSAINPLPYSMDMPYIIALIFEKSNLISIIQINNINLIVCEYFRNSLFKQFEVSTIHTTYKIDM